MNYQTPTDLENEDRVAKIVEKKWGCRLFKMSYAYIIDFLLQNKQGFASAVVEIKCRTNSLTAFPETIVDLSKWNAGIDYTIKNGLIFVLIFEFTDGIYYYIYSPSDVVRIEWAGRTVKYRDPNDIKPWVYIPIEWLKPL